MNHRLYAMRALSTLAVGCALSVVCISGVRAAETTTHHKLSKYLPTLHEGETLPDVALVDQRNVPFAFSALRGQTVVLAFVYTRCPDRDGCPLVSAKFARLQHVLASERVHLVQISLDPVHDTPNVLARYGSSFAANPRRWTLATGDASAVAEIAARVGLTDSVDSNAIEHSDALAIVDPSGRLTKTIDGNEWTVAQVAAEARSALGEQPGPVARFELWLAAGVSAVCGSGKAGISMGAALLLFITLLLGLGSIVRRLYYEHE